MIPDSMNVHDDMRRQRLHEGAFEKGNHRAEDTGRGTSAKSKVRMGIAERRSVEHPTSNRLRASGAHGRSRTLDVGCWMLDVGCSAFSPFFRVLLLLLALSITRAEDPPTEFKWRVLLEPKSMRREVTWEI